MTPLNQLRFARMACCVRENCLYLQYLQLFRQSLILLLYETREEI